MGADYESRCHGYSASKEKRECSDELCALWNGKLRSYRSHAEGLAVELSEFAVLLAFLPHAFAKQVD